MVKWISLGDRLKQLKHLVNPSRFPVAVKFLEREDEIPHRAKRPL
jgi:uncharacterized protein (DUF169 family)